MHLDQGLQIAIWHWLAAAWSPAIAAQTHSANLPSRRPFPMPAVLLAQAAKQWQQEHGGALPSSTPERDAFKELLKSWQRNIDGIPLEVGAGGMLLFHSCWFVLD